MVEHGRVGQVSGRVARRPHVALRLLEGPSGVRVAPRDLGTAVPRGTLVVALEKEERTRSRLFGEEKRPVWFHRLRVHRRPGADECHRVGRAGELVSSPAVTSGGRLRVHYPSTDLTEDI